MIDTHDTRLSISAQCRLLDVPRSSFYHRPAETPAADEKLMRFIDEQYLATTIALTLAAEILRLRPRPGRTSVRALGPPAAKRSFHMMTVGRLTARERAISLFDSPAAAKSTMRAHMATLCGVEWAATQRSRTRRSSSETIVLATFGSMVSRLS
jgi:hypothetical protein